MEQSPNLRLPYLMPSQAQKHVTHNDALRSLDAVVQVGAISKTLTLPPATPLEGDRYIVAAGATGSWVGKDNQLAALIDGAWMFHVPAVGWLVWIGDESRLNVWNGSAWTQAAIASVNPVGMVGINAIADAANRLAVKSESSLFSHDDVTPGAGNHRLVVNKAAASNTSSAVWQNDFSGRAELGLMGDDKFRIKVSPDGASWNSPFCIDNANGRIGVGTDAPATILHIRYVDTTHPLIVREDASGAPTFQMDKARGTPGAPAATGDGDAGLTFYGRFHDGGQFRGGAMQQWFVDGAVASNNFATKCAIFTRPAGVGGVLTGRLEITGAATRPFADNAYSLGDATHRFTALWAANGTIQTSDMRDKAVLPDSRTLLELHAPELVREISPILFRWKSGGNEIVRHSTKTEPGPEGVPQPKPVAKSRPGRRVHAGFSAQDVGEALYRHGVDFGAWGLTDAGDANSRQWIRPDQLIPVLWETVRQLMRRIDRLEQLPEPAHRR